MTFVLGFSAGMLLTLAAMIVYGIRTAGDDRD